MPKTTPYKHQNQAFEFIKDKYSFSLAMEMGTGKSKIVLMKTEYLIDQKKINKILILLPNYLKDTWITDHFHNLFDKDFLPFIYKGRITSNKQNKIFEDFCNSDKFRVFVVDVEAFQTETIDNYIKQFINNDKKVFIVVDESTSIKNPEAKRTKKILEGFKNGFKYKCILSGTLLTKSPVDLYTQYNFLQDNFFKCSFFQFKSRHVILLNKKNHATNKNYSQPLTFEDYETIKRGIKKLTDKELTPDIISELSLKYSVSESNLIRIHNMAEFTPYKDMNKLKEQISKITFFMRKEDCLDLPEKIYEKIYVDFTPEQKRLYLELINSYITNYKGDNLEVKNVLGLTIRLRMITGGIFPYIDLSGIDFDTLWVKDYNSPTLKKYKRIDNNPKIKAIIEDIKENTSDNEPIIIWSNFIETIKYVYDEIKPYFTCAMYYGETKNKEEIVADFKSGKIRIFIGNPLIAGMGMNFQHCALQYIFDNSYRTDLRMQLEDRSHRIGQTKHVIYKDVFIKASIDEKVFLIVKQGIDLIDYFKSPANVKEFVFSLKNV